jgi:hypothetical protein
LSSTIKRVTHANAAVHLGVGGFDMRAIALIAMFTIIVSGCTSFKTADSQSTEVAVSNLSVGDTVRIATADGNSVQFTIEAIDDDALIGDGLRVLKDDIRLVSVERFDAPETALGVGTVVIFILVLLPAIALVIVTS